MHYLCFGWSSVRVPDNGRKFGQILVQFVVNFLPDCSRPYNQITNVKIKCEGKQRARFNCIFTDFLLIRRNPNGNNIVAINLSTLIEQNKRLCTALARMTIWSEKWSAFNLLDRTWQNGTFSGRAFLTCSIQESGSLNGDQSATTASNFNVLTRWGMQTFESPLNKWNSILSFLHSTSTSFSPVICITSYVLLQCRVCVNSQIYHRPTWTQNDELSLLGTLVPDRSRHGVAVSSSVPDAEHIIKPSYLKRARFIVLVNWPSPCSYSY